MIGAGIATFAVVSYVGWTHKEEIMDFLTDVIDSHSKPCRAIGSIQTVDVKDEIKSTPILSNMMVSVEQKITHRPHDVSGHLRKLPEGWNPSPEKIVEAQARGIDLPKGYTFVGDYSTGTMVA